MKKLLLAAIVLAAPWPIAAGNPATPLVEEFTEGDLSTLANPVKRSALYEEVAAELWSQEECRLSDDHEWNAFNPECLRLFLERYQHAFPDLVQVHAIGRTVDDSDTSDSRCIHRGTCRNEILAVRLGSREIASRDKPTALFVGGIHGGERSPMRVLLDWVDYLTQHYVSATSGATEVPAYGLHTSDSGRTSTLTINDLLGRFDIWIVPLLSHHSWHENAKPNAHGVNLDRDWGYDWGHRSSSPEGPRVWDGNAGGTGAHPFSQPETRALQGLAEAIGPAVYVNIHGYRGGFNSATSPLSNSCAGGLVTDAGLLDVTEMGPHWAVVRPPSLGNDVLRYVYRGTTDDRISYTGVSMFDSVPMLADQNARVFSCADDWLVEGWNAWSSDERIAHCPPPIFWAPFSEWRACYGSLSLDDTLRGKTSGSYGQSHGYFWAELGALSFLVEVPRFYWGRDPDDVEDRTRSVNAAEPDAGDDEGVDRWYTKDENEHYVRKVVSDTFFALNRLVVIAANPIPDVHPASAPGSRHNLAISGLHTWSGSGEEECDYSMTFAPVYDHDCCDPLCDFNGNSCQSIGLVESPYESGAGLYRDSLLRNGYHGERQLACSVTNWGNEAHTDAFQVRLSIEDLTAGAGPEVWDCRVASMGGTTASTRHQADTSRCEWEDGGTYEFTKDHTYRVRCELTDTLGNVADATTANPLGETDVAAFTRSDSFECQQTSGSLAGCQVNSSSSQGYDRLWTTNNHREQVFKATIDQYAVCRQGRIAPQNVNGHPSGHVPAVTGL